MLAETERLILREIGLDDWESIHTYTVSPEVTKYTAWGPNTEQDTTAYIEQVLQSQQEQPRSQYDLAVCLKTDGTLVGSVGIYTEGTNAEMGYVMNPQYQGRGFAAEASHALLGLGFNTLGVHRIYAKCRPNNKASERVMQKIGMEYEGLMREHWFYKGAFHDSLLYSILAREYAQLQKADIG
ncbi:MULTISPECIES: GNAT family N-acetyltransferase [Paenibacillus]|uniref:GNAT family N-acetyltransferase n=1 Tax=Paenibacillus TaxID=44249 RepID=UPI000BA683F8|nr:GNAT family protein [Paenibacillus sp. 7523-1]PAD28904.1 GNAT family N-acetyltransferase [Paenibacillus sp. 7523-1]